MNGSLRSGPDQANSSRRFLISSGLAIMASGQKANRSVGLSIITHSSSIYKWFGVASGLSSQILPRFDVVQCTDYKIELRVKRIVVLFVVDAVAKRLDDEFRCYFCNLYL